MVKVGIFIILAWTVVACQLKPQTSVGIRVDNLIEGDYESSVITRDSTYRVVLDSAGRAILMMPPNEESGYATFRYHGMSVPIYIESGKSFEVNAKKEEWSLKASFSGENVKKNEYLNNEALLGFYPDFKLDEADFLESLEQQEREYLTLLDSMDFENTFTPIEKRRIHYLVYMYLPNYLSYRKYQLQDREYEASDDFFSKLKGAIPEEEELMRMPEYQRAVMNLISAFGVYQMEGKDEWKYLKNQLDYIEKNINSPLLKDFSMDKLATRYVDSHGTDHLEEIVRFYHDNVQSLEKRVEFDKMCSQWIKLVKGQPSPVFKCLDIDGKEVSLTDFRGKYVYIDIWATWCVPCRKELPYLEQLARKYEGKNIYFLSLSCDRDREAWEKMVKNDQLKGIQIHCGRRDSFIKEYRVYSIPRFILIDPDGNILNAQMPRPSDPETEAFLDALPGI